MSSNSLHYSKPDDAHDPDKSIAKGLRISSILGLIEGILNLFAAVNGREQHQQRSSSHNQAKGAGRLIALII